MLSLVHLKVLAAVARHGSVTEAVRELHYSQPSVSHHLARLEAATGAKLIQRVGRGIRLTPEGELLAQRATEILRRVDAPPGGRGAPGRGPEDAAGGSGRRRPDLPGRGRPVPGGGVPPHPPAGRPALPRQPPT